MAHSRGKHPGRTRTTTSSPVGPAVYQPSYMPFRYRRVCSAGRSQTETAGDGRGFGNLRRQPSADGARWGDSSREPFLAWLKRRNLSVPRVGLVLFRRQGSLGESALPVELVVLGGCGPNSSSQPTSSVDHRYKISPTIAAITPMKTTSPLSTGLPFRSNWLPEPWPGLTPCPKGGADTPLTCGYWGTF